MLMMTAIHSILAQSKFIKHSLKFAVLILSLMKNDRKFKNSSKFIVSFHFFKVFAAPPATKWVVASQSTSAIIFLTFSHQIRLLNNQ